MSLISGRPPYDMLEAEQLARRFAEGSAYWCFYNSKEAQYVFQIPLFSMNPGERLKLAEDGALILFELVDGENRLLPNDLPKFRSLKWLDRDSALVVLSRSRDLEFAAGKAGVPSLSEVSSGVDAQEAARVAMLPELRKLAARAR